MNSEQEIGEIIRALRGEESLRDFANKCGLAHTTIDNLEKGYDYRTGKTLQTKMVTLRKIANACNFPIEGFMGNSIKYHTNLRAARTGRSKSIQETASAGNISVFMYLLIENNIEPIQTDCLTKLEAFFNIDKRFLCGDKYTLGTPKEDWRPDIVDDYNNASEPLKKFLEYKYGSLIYENTSGSNFSDSVSHFKLKNVLTPREMKIILEYRSHPEMQAAVDRILGITDETVNVYAAACSADNRKDGLEELEANKYQKLSTAPETDEELR